MIGPWQTLIVQSKVLDLIMLWSEKSYVFTFSWWHNYGPINSKLQQQHIIKLLRDCAKFYNIC